MSRFLKHAAAAVLEGSLIAALVVGLLVSTAFAGKAGAGTTGGKGKPGATTGSIALVMVTDRNGNGAANWDDQVTYDVSRAGVQNPFITTTCSQSGTNVLTTYAGYYP